MVDLILYCDLEAVIDEEGKTSYRRVMRTKPSPHYEAGDRTGRLPETLELDFAKFTEAFNRPAAKNTAQAAKPATAGDPKPQPNTPRNGG